MQVIPDSLTNSYFRHQSEIATDSERRPCFAIHLMNTATFFADNC